MGSFPTLSLLERTMSLPQQTPPLWQQPEHHASEEAAHPRVATGAVGCHLATEEATVNIVQPVETVLARGWEYAPE